jgi:2-polyprenyl-3-methyl-5-hydroxy-6-metoxy-1,4-benzoquinol methylase
VARFAYTNSIIAREFGSASQILEIGSGEGHQTEWLLKLGGSVHGREISPRAVKRARKRCPEATFSVGDLSSPFPPGIAPPFDLVAACEVLYFMADPSAAVRQMSQLGHACLVTYFQRYKSDVEARVEFPKTARRETIHFEDLQWSVAWWTN